MVVDLVARPKSCSSAARVVGLQPVALLDYVARVDWALLDAIPGERGGSFRVSPEELEKILAEVNNHILSTPEMALPIRSMAGGSVANTVRGLSAGFGIPSSIVGACGDDEQGKKFVLNMEKSGVNLSKLRFKRGPTGQCACLVDAEGNRTMRPCLSNAVRLQDAELTNEDFRGSQWLVLNGYGFYGQQLVETAASLAKKEGLQVSMDLASFEVVRNFRPQLLALLKSGHIDLCIANEDEAKELMRGEPNTEAESALEFLSKYCTWAVVMLGPKGCIARHGKEVVRVPAFEGTQAIDTTGAGDLFASGFLYGMVEGFPLADCCRVGCCAGAAVVRNLGGEDQTQCLPVKRLKFQNRLLKFIVKPIRNIMTVKENDDVVLSPANESDPRQQWFMDETFGIRVKDEAGIPAFALVNRATRLALKHGSEENEKVTICPYSKDDTNVAILWTHSADDGSGYRCIRPVDNKDLNLDANHGDAESGGIRDGNGLILFKGKKHDTQKWKIFPISQGSISEVTGHYVPQPQPPQPESKNEVMGNHVSQPQPKSISEVTQPPQSESVSEVIAPHHRQPEVHCLDHVPEGQVVKIYCQQSPSFFLTVRNGEVVLAHGNENDVTQHWMVVTERGNKIKDEAGFPAFALVSKATLKALKHGSEEWDG